MTPKTIAIIGTYRSGSSAVAEILEKLGVWMGAPYWFDYFESAEMAAALRSWWAEPDMVETVAQNERVDGLACWLENQQALGHSTIGLKHPLLTLSANDVLQAWGGSTKFIWTKRPWEDSVESLKNAMGWPRAHLAQSFLWMKAADFCAGNAHLAVEFSDLMRDPEDTIQRLISFLGLDCTGEQMAAALNVVRPAKKTIRKSSPPALSRRSDIINWLITRQSYQSYLEIGIDTGANFRAIRCKEKVGVDPASVEQSYPHPIYSVTSDGFFLNNTRSFDLIFIDGLHHEEVVSRDIRNARKCLSSGGMIVVHDLNPTCELIQRVPRESCEWTGDCWKAWVRLRWEEPELPMIVVNADYGLGIIYPSGSIPNSMPPEPRIEANWSNFEKYRREWLNLFPPVALPQLLFGETSTRLGVLTVVTLWRGDWNSAQAALLDWLGTEPFPKHTKFVWTVPSGSRTEFELERRWDAFEQSGCDYSCELITTPDAKVTSNVEKHHRVAALYNEALGSVNSEWVMFVEDDVIPEPGGALRLLSEIQRSPLDTACIAAVYRVRENPANICATDSHWRYFKWPEDNQSGLTEVLWTGGGFAVYQGQALLDAGPLFAKSEGNRLLGGWDDYLCKNFRSRGYRVLVDMGNRADHRFE